MHDWKSLSHVRWECKYHIVIIPKYRKRELYGQFRNRVGEVIRDLCRQRGVELLEGHLMGDHIHMCLSIPPADIEEQTSNRAAFLGTGILCKHGWIG